MPPVIWAKQKRRMSACLSKANDGRGGKRPVRLTKRHTQQGFAMPTILVTGATGFVGSHALEALMQFDAVRRGEFRVIAACRDPARLLPGFAGEVRAGDLCDAAYLAHLLEGVDVVCHCMAWTSLFGQKKHSRALYLHPTLALLDAAVAQGVRRFVNISTTSAAAPGQSHNPMNPGIPRTFWPHLGNAITIENALRQRSHAQFTGVNLRLGIFAGRRYALGLLPILVPRLKTHGVPWVEGGQTGLPITAGEDIGTALACTTPGLSGYESFNIVGPAVPRVREVFELLHEEFGLPLPHFSVPFPVAYAFAWLMEKLDVIVPWQPLVTRSIIHLLEETQADNRRAAQRLGYRPKVDWREAIRMQMAEMQTRQTAPMRMHRPLPSERAP